MRRKNTNSGRSKVKAPPVSKDPEIFEEAFRRRLGQNPEDYLLDKIQGGSELASIEYLFNMMVEEIARQNHCTAIHFAHYHKKVRERIRAMKKTTVYNKLVRDKIPEIIEASGKTCVTELLPRDAYIQALDAKLSEELTEYQQSKSLEELADLLEVMGAVVKARGYTWEDLTRIRKEKRARRGAFDQRIFLKEVQE